VDGFIRQWGYVSGSTAQSGITFKVPFVNTGYAISGTERWANSASATGVLKSINKESFAWSTSTNFVYWLAEGY
jgi:hypothetical protein